MHAELEYLVMKNRAEELRRVADDHRLIRQVSGRRRSLISKLFS
ncbi:hypothetical protein [Nonomuraea sp. 3-1Str]|nr:hypothetical protein [Nonomuraea sp. 3-1Str]